METTELLPKITDVVRTIARGELEDTRALVDRVREKTAIRARIGNAVREHAGTIAMVVGGFILLFAIGRLRRALAS